MSSAEEDFHVKIAADLATHTQMLSDILTQTTKTNGRVTRLEGTVSNHATVLALAADAKGRSEWWRDKIGTAFIALLFTAVGSTILLVLQKTNIVDVSVVSEEEYQQLP